ncbi:ferrochelatase 1 [Actinidia rufa]|uniref:Ferrochelatase n=1 Tax=Actinidia rufa TaxID=165716 RepID=A0A7J0GCM5_9ERIC|nr:ferrochelatase 1 [Actinidia rufa]
MEAISCSRVNLPGSTLRNTNHRSSLPCHQTRISMSTCPNSSDGQAYTISCLNPTDKQSGIVSGSYLRGPLQKRDLSGKTFCSLGVCTYTGTGSASESHSHAAEERVGVLLLNLGGPETLHDVQPFLFNLFADPDIIRLPRPFKFLQRPLAQLISVLRAPKSKEGYASIGGGSPLRKITDDQAFSLKKALDAKEMPVNVYVAMRYWHPFTEEAVQQVMIFFSAHGVPVSYVENAGDPYRDQMEDCIHLIMQELKSRGICNDHTLAYQSRVGPVKWLKPYTDEVLVELGQKGVKSLLAVPVSFVSEHIETLDEIDREYKELALESGIENWGRVPALGCNPSFITDLADAVIEALPSATAMKTPSMDSEEEEPYLQPQP